MGESDCHGLQTEDKAVSDEVQSYELISGYQNETHTTVEFRRQLDTCDVQDFVIGPATQADVSMIYSLRLTDFGIKLPALAPCGSGAAGDHCQLYDGKLRNQLNKALSAAHGASEDTIQVLWALGPDDSDGQLPKHVKSGSKPLRLVQPIPKPDVMLLKYWDVRLTNYQSTRQDESNEPKLDGVVSFNYGVPMATAPSSDPGYHIAPKYSVRRIKRAQTRWGCVVDYGVPMGHLPAPSSDSGYHIAPKYSGKTNQTIPNSMGLVSFNYGVPTTFQLHHQTLVTI
ncbi:hypothetical protein EVAR_83052_1 [Eumeta japonica]|uniref:DOMON domain-containing protein n=1 Tax=Eumeta variegata TaxID=151549 RepID=A0A4C1VQ56_EUMVA|nr:hypothetical protein EVAR_83052_1 [Eumeta japonica]